jgi:predicted RNA-binding protein with RPS1 domain
VDGEVTGVRSHAAFVDLAQGCCGLLHISQVSQERFETVEQVFKVSEGVCNTCT